MINSYKTGLLVNRDWGSYEILHVGEAYTIKKLTILPGKKTSLQKHKHRCEHLVVVRGSPSVLLADKITKSGVNTPITIREGELHQIINDTSESVIIIELLYGKILDEADIVRIAEL